MSEKLESSVVVSLQELLSLEEQRNAEALEVRHQREQRAEAARQAALDAERRVALEQGREEEESQRRAAQAEREEEARLAGIRETETARIAAEVAREAQLEKAEMHHRHEREILQARAAESLKSTRIAAGVLAVLLLCTLLLGALGWRAHRGADERLALARQGELQSTARRLGEAEEELSTLRKEQLGLRAVLDETQSALERARETARRLAAEKPASSSGSRGWRPQVRGPQPAQEEALPGVGTRGGCAEGDPLCAQ